MVPHQGHLVRKTRPPREPRFQKCRLGLLEDRTLPAPVMALVNRMGDSGQGSAPLPAGRRHPLHPRSDQQAFYAGSTVNFDTTKTGPTITLSGLGELKISQNTIINGPGASSLTIDGNARNVNGVSTNLAGTRVFNITAQNITVTISGLTITDGNAKPAPNNSGNQGGDIFNSGKLIAHQ